jgi:peptidoglycan hydrolase-like protein with peptidoglycan-binding domain
MKRKYTGWDADAPSRRAGNERFIQYVTFLTGNGLWNNGSWTVRSKRGKQTPSVHGTGRATDFSWRNMGNKGYGDYAKACEFINFLVANADALMIECVFDYYPAPWGRGWRCDRSSWTQYTKKAFGGAPSGDWFHIEIAPSVADDPGHFDRVFASLLGKPAEATQKPVETPVSDAKPVQAPQPPQKPQGPTKRPYPGKPLVRGSRGEDVVWVQKIIGATPDGDFGPRTVAALRRWQSLQGMAVDGTCGPVTWNRLNVVFLAR